ncbi:hypothetical protein Clacol_002207 [Clathrus columnatus]|uniref:Uncharacterized protein n=1 Tax=Clathrus columnatus TaxID=1419009 RepID=A0AAV5A4Q7_9AGAM|nr:hypothetical protein Clacol_002207 [Clathrus columnatus]
MKFADFPTAESVAKAFQGEIKGKTVLITGITQGGYGAEVARVLTLFGAKVILAGRSIDKIRETAKVIKKETPTAEFRELVIDLGSQKSVRQAAAQVLEFQEPIDVLMLNAGINYQTIRPTRALDLDFGGGKDYDKWAAYAQSKTANILFAVELAERYRDKNLLAFSLDPGASATSLQQYMTKEDFIRFHYAYHPDGRPKGDWLGTVQENSATLRSFYRGYVSYTLSSRCKDTQRERYVDQNGSYLVKCQVTTDPEDLRPYACDKECARTLWALSEEIVGQKFDV